MTDADVSHFSVNMSDCFVVDGDCVHSPDSVAWSPHNVLFVATHWTLYLHVNDLIAANTVIRPAYQSCGDTSSQMCICGAKWALDLVPEEAYPVTCRLCIRTTRDLFVYRVMRYGIDRLRVSHGVCFIPKHVSGELSKTAVALKKKGSKRTRSPTRNNSATTSATTNDETQITSCNVPGLCIVSYEWFPSDILVVVTLHGIYLLNFDGDTSDETTLQRRLFPSPAFCFSGSPVEGLSASCATRVLGCSIDDMQLMVACPYWLCIFTISIPCVYLRHYIEVPLLCGIPTAVCSFIEDVKLSTLRVFVSAPTCVLQGTITLCISKDTAIQTRRMEWNTTESWSAESGLGDEMGVSRFLAISLESFDLFDITTTVMSDCSAASVKTSGESFLVLGVCRRRLLGFVGRRCVELIRCARVDGISLPHGVAVELSGVAVHNSCTLSIVGLRFSKPRYPPFHLFPLTVNNSGGFLSRFIQSHERFAGISNGTIEGGSSITLTTGQKPNGVLFGLWNRQQSTSYFIWEELLSNYTLSTVSTYLQYLQDMDRVIENPIVKEEGKMDISFSSLPPYHWIMRKLQQNYLDLREKYSIELFLRFPDVNAEWRQILLHIWRRCPGNLTLRELVLANAIQHIAEKTNYAGFKYNGNTMLSSEGNLFSLEFIAALQYGKLYYTHCKEGNGWTYRKTFAEQLGNFLDTVETRWKQQQEGKGEGEGEGEQLKEAPRFPCSICLKKGQTLLTLSLSSLVNPEEGKKGAKDCVDGYHFTVFSASTFTPLSFVTQDEVVSRCQSCAMYDYVTNPLCRVCGGLML